MAAPSEVTQLLKRWSEGDREALADLVPLVYEQLKGIAHARLLRERPGHTLNTTGLVHEAYLKLVEIDRLVWKNRSQFLAVASSVMRHVLVDYANQRKAQKRGGGAAHVELDEERLLISDSQADRLLVLDEALKHLEKEHPRAGKALELHYFGGLTQAEVGELLNISQPTAMRDLRFARAWLARVWDVTA